MLVETSLDALAAGEQVQLGPGDVLRVCCRFKYVVAVDTTATLWASLGISPGRDIEAFREISLEATLTPKTWEGDIDIVIPASGKTDGTYWLRAEIKGFGETQVTIDDAVVISGMPAGMTDMLEPLMMVMMLGMLVNVTGEI
jgi:hypothetical protein